MLIGMSVNAWSSVTKTYVFTAKSWTATCDGKAANWTSGKDGTGLVNNGIQVTTTTSGANGTSPVSFANISQIVITYNTNKSTGAGSFDVKIGTNDATTKIWGYSGSSDGTSANFTQTFSYVTPQSGSVKITANTTTNSVYIVQVAITYNPPVRMVAYDAHDGGTLSPEEDIVEEAEGGAGVTLPNVTLNSALSAAGWGFYGWAETPVGTETTTAPTIVGKAGDTYYPDDDIELHAVYANGEYTKITGTTSITNGDKIIVVGYDDTNSKVYAMTADAYTNTNEFLKGKQIGTSPSATYNAAVMQGEWRCEITYSTANQFYIRNITLNKYVDTQASTSGLLTSTAYSSEWYNITFANTSDGYCNISNNTSSYGGRYLVIDNGDFGKSTTAYNKMMLYKESTTPRYNSEPCGNIVSLSAGTESYAEITSFSETGVETCGTGEDDRKVTISVTAATGYELTSSARLTFTKSSGTATATYVSGPTGSGPNYTFVYQFTKDDSGAGTFSVTATAKQCTITFDKNDGEGGSDGTTATYDAAMPDITPPTRIGYTFDGYWDAETSNNGSGTQYYKADGTSKKNWDKNTTSATTLYAKWNINSYTLSIASVDHVTISSTSPSVAAGSSTSVNYGTTVTLNHGTPSDGRTWSGWNAYKTSDTGTPVAVDGSNQFTMPAYDVTVSANLYGDFVFSCSELTLTPHLATEETPIFITSTASKTVRSQDYIEITGSGLTPSTALTFPGLPSKFAIKNADGTAVTTDENGEISANAYIFYTPDAGDTSDGLDKLVGITASVDGAKPKTVVLEQEIYGRHLPADFVIAGKKDGKWWAMPSDMASTTNPTPVEIAVNDATNPSIAYTVSSTYYGLAGPTAKNISDGNGQYIRFAMSIDDGTLDPHAAPLFGTTGTTLGKSGNSQITSDLSASNWWKLVQTNTSITNPQDAKYTICCANNTQSLTIEDGGKWGLYATNGTDVDELRLIPASTVVPTEAYFVEWSQYGGVVEVDAQGVGATKVQAVLNGTESVVKTLIQTKASDAKNKTSKYNYTINFNDLGKEIDFADAESNGAMLTLRWLDNSEDLVAVSNITVPKIIASSATMSSIESGDTPWSKWEVHVLPGVTLTANAGDFSSKDVIINQLEIYPGATVKVTKGAQDVGTLKVKTLVLRNGWTRVGEKAYDVARLYVPTDANLAKSAGGDVWYSDWYIDYDQYYPIAVPFPVATSEISYKNTTSAASNGVKLRYYSGELRATNIQQNQDQNWVEYTWGVGGTMPATLEPSKGYIMTAKRPTGKAFSIVRMPLTFSNDWTALGEKGEVSGTHKDQVAVMAWGDENTPSYAKGWNIIANPFMALHQGALSYTDKGTIEYANIPDINFKEYDQLPIATTKLKPSSAFLVQAPKDGTVTFGTTNRQASAPSYRREVQAETLPTQRAYIVLANDDAEDMMGIWISDKYSAEYEINADLEKLLGDGKSLRTYMHWNEMKMAYLAINKELAQQWIPVSVRIETEGEHTFSMHSASKISELKGVYLIDFETGAMTNLLESSYPFYSTAGTINDRFAINALVGPRDVPTELDIVRDGNEGSGPIKFIYHDKVFILHEGVIYDSTGKKVREIKK